MCRTSYTTIPTVMTDQHPSLRRRRANLMRRLQSLPPEFLRGSLIEQYKKCGKPGCRCADGRGHGPKHYLSVSMPGRRPEMMYVPQAYVERVEEFLAKFKAARELMEEICEINRELLKRREEF
ncbi:DUF6788 family protein [Myxococcota bacterium]